MEAPFDNLEKYRALLASVNGSVREQPPLLDTAPRQSELELQSLWFGGALGRDFSSEDDQSVRVVQFGHWNHGAGPDFRDCAVEIDGELRKGDIELDPEPADWEQHGHGGNPAFNDVVLHVYPGPGDEPRFFTRTSEHRAVPQVALDLEELLADSPRYRFLPEARLGRCAKPLEAMEKARVETLLRGAALHRLQLKARRLLATAEIHGRDEALYQGIAEAFGYRPNKLPMRILAQRFPLKELQRLRPVEREARLFGAGGFLRHDAMQESDADTRLYLRELWDQWWKIRDDTGERPHLSWHLAGIRPSNHPHRRLGALAELVARWSELAEWMPGPGESARDHWPRQIHRLLADLEHDYWSHHYTLKSALVEKKLALVGKERIHDILGNICFPLVVHGCPDQWTSYVELPGSQVNEKVRRAITRLFGDRPEAEEWTGKFHQQQALLQIYEDFCLEDHSECADCPFPEQLAQW